MLYILNIFILHWRLRWTWTSVGARPIPVSPQKKFMFYIYLDIHYDLYIMIIK